MTEKTNKYCHCLYYSANAFAREIGKFADEEFTSSGLAPSHAFLLMAVIDNPGLQPMEISRIMMLSPSTITRFIEKLEVQGLVTRTISGKNTSVQPTDKGLALKDKLAECWQSLFQRYTSVLGKGKSKKLTAKVYKAALLLKGE